jgi:hypothetical protein
MGHVYFDMLERFYVPQLDVNSVISQQDKAPSPLTQGCDAVPEPNIPEKMDRSWRLHSVATQITRSDTHELFILRIHKTNNQSTIYNLPIHLKANKGYTVRKIENINGYIIYC